MNYIDTLLRAREQGKAIGAFNIFNDISIRAAVSAAEAKHRDIILQTSVKTVRNFGADRLYRLVHAVTDTASVHVFLHLDHCKDIGVACECIDAGWDSIMYDGSALPFQENIANTCEVVHLAHDKGIFVEGELGKISGIEEDIEVEMSASQLATYEESIRFVEETGIDAFAPAIGTAHGVYRGVPHIDFNLVERLGKEIKQPIVIHGGTGLSENTFHRLIQSGGCKINVSTALKNAYIEALRECFISEVEKQSGEPLDIDACSLKAVYKVVFSHIDLFNN